MTILKYKHTFLGLLALTAPLGFLPILPNRLYLTWLLMFQGLLVFPEPSYLNLWLECLFLDFLYEIPVGTSFLSFSAICLSVNTLHKNLIVVPFAVLWSLTTVVMICLDVLFFQSMAWQVLTRQRSLLELGAIASAYPLVTCVIKKLHSKQATPPSPI
jgi:hypothetical protein